MQFNRETMWSIVAAGAAAAAGVAARNALKASWRLATHKDPPLNPADADTPWRQAILWTAAMGASVGVIRMLARRGAAAGWEAYYRDTPPGLESKLSWRGLTRHVGSHDG